MLGEFKKFFVEMDQDQTVSWHKNPTDDEVDLGADPNIKTPEQLGLKPGSLAYQIQAIFNQHKQQRRQQVVARRGNDSTGGQPNQGNVPPNNTTPNSHDPTVMVRRPMSTTQQQPQPQQPQPQQIQQQPQKQGFMAWLGNHLKRNVA